VAKNAPSLKSNVAANYASQIYVMAISIVMTPVYLRYLGTEAYGLIGFFTMMSAWFQLLDVGLSPTLMREVARFRGGAIDGKKLRDFMRVLEAIFFGTSTIGALAMVLGADFIAGRWLNVQHLAVADVRTSIVLMGLSVPLRWTSGLYRGAITGFEQQVWLSGYNLAIATVRFVGVLAVFYLFGATPVDFFLYQLLIAVLELVGLVIKAYILLPGTGGQSVRPSLSALKGNLTFSAIIAFTTTVWVFATQLDKLVLSNILPLSEYGMFSVAMTAAMGVTMISGPFGVALMPRLTKLVAEGNEAEVRRLYSRFAQGIGIFCAPAVAVLCFFSERVLYGWTGNAVLAQHAAPYLALYGAGNGCVVYSGYCYAIQYARGDLRLHLWSNVVLIAVLLPLFVVMAKYAGGVGTGAVWLAVNGISFLFWVPVVHARFLPGEHKMWLLRDVSPILFATLFVGWALSRLVQFPADRWAAFFLVCGIGVVLMAVAVAASSEARNAAKAFAGRVGLIRKSL
jgi:O-antigen/teichoic acid export membrane protein